MEMKTSTKHSEIFSLFSHIVTGNVLILIILLPRLASFGCCPCLFVLFILCFLKVIGTQTKRIQFM